MNPIAEVSSTNRQDSKLIHTLFSTNYRTVGHSKFQKRVKGQNFAFIYVSVMELKEGQCILSCFSCHSHSDFCIDYPVAFDRTRR